MKYLNSWFKKWLKLILWKELIYLKSIINYISFKTNNSLIMNLTLKLENY